MEKQIYQIGNGEIAFDADKILIRDNAPKEWRWRLIASSTWVVYGLLSVLRFLKTGDQFLLWSGLLIGIGHLVLIVLTLLRSNKNEIRREEVLSMEIKQRFGNSFLDIRLADNKIRRVNQIDAIEVELRQYIEENFNKKREMAG